MAEAVTRHLSEGEIVAAADNALSADRTAHMRSCANCRQEVEGWRNAASVLGSIRCPAPEDLANYAAGAESDPSVGEHIEECEVCRAAIEIAREDAPAAQVVELPSRRWWYAAAAAAILASCVSLWWWLEHRHRGTEALLAEAYTEARPFEYRLFGAAYKPFGCIRAENRPLTVPQP